jgi:hypothetical protein
MISAKGGTEVPISGTKVQKSLRKVLTARSYQLMVSEALKAELAQTRWAVNTVGDWTGASERTVKNWFQAKKGPSGLHLVLLAAHSDAVLEGILKMARRDGCRSRMGE